MQLTVPRQRFSSLVPSLVGVGLVLALGFGFFGVFQRLTSGHEEADYGSYIPWGLWVAAYVYFIGLSAGSFLLSALVYVVGVKALAPIGKLALFTSVVTLLMALIMIWLDIGHMERFWYVYAYGRPTSMMAWMVWLYTAYFVLVLAEFWFAIRADLAVWAREPGKAPRFVAFPFFGRRGEAEPVKEEEDDPPGDDAAQPGLRGRIASLLLFGQTDTSAEALEADRRWLRTLGTIGVPLAIAFHGGVGALFGVVAARPYWNAALYPIAFIVGALASGGALLTFVTAFFWPERGTREHRQLVTLLGRMTLALLLFYLLLEWAEFSIAVYGDIPAEEQPYTQILTGQYWWVFWLVHLTVGAFLPVAMMTWQPRSALWVGGASALIVATFMAVRLNVVIPGLVVPQFEGLETAFVDDRLNFDYLPSMMEWLVLVFVGTVGVLVFYVGQQLLPLWASQREEEP